MKSRRIVSSFSSRVISRDSSSFCASPYEMICTASTMSAPRVGRSSSSRSGGCARGPGVADWTSLRQLARAAVQPAGDSRLVAGRRSRRPLYPAVAARRADHAALPQDQGHPPPGVGHGAGSPERRNHRLRCGAVLWPAQLGEAARRPADHADGGGEGVPGRADA